MTIFKNYGIVVKCFILWLVSLILILNTVVQGKALGNAKEDLITEKVIQIIQNEKRLHGIQLSNNEVKEAMAFLFEKHGITVSTFSKIAEQGKIIIAGLQLVVDKKNSPEKVYNKLNMELNGINQDTWNYYLKNYSTDEKIKVLEALNPDTMEKIIKSGSKQFGEQLSDWLLFRKIIIDFDAKFPKKEKMSAEQKEKQWWNTALKKYHLEQKQEKSILEIITVSRRLSCSDATLMEEFFKQKTFHSQMNHK